MKKILKTLCALSIVVVLAACNEEAGSGAPAPAAKTNFAVSLPGVPETYGVEDPQAAGQIAPYYNDVTVYLVDAGGNMVGHAWSDDEISSRQKRFEQIVEPSKVLVFVNTAVFRCRPAPFRTRRSGPHIFRLQSPGRTRPSRPLRTRMRKAMPPGITSRCSR